MNRRMDRQILKIFLPGFQIQSEILMDFWILQSQCIADSYIFGPEFWPLRVIKIFLPGFWIHCNNWRADLVNKS